MKSLRYTLRPARVPPLQTRSTAARAHVIQGATADSHRTAVEKVPARSIQLLRKRLPTEHQRRRRIILPQGQAQEAHTLLLLRLLHQDHAAIQHLPNPTAHLLLVRVAAAQGLQEAAAAIAAEAVQAAAQAVRAAEAAPAVVVPTVREEAHAEAGKNP